MNAIIRHTSGNVLILQSLCNPSKTSPVKEGCVFLFFVVSRATFVCFLIINVR